VKLVLDTNVVVDWLVFDDPFLAAFRESVREGRVTICTHTPAIDELQRVLTYPELKLNAAKQAQVLETYRAQTSVVPGGDLPPRFLRCRDPDDDHFLALAYLAKADALISRDHAVLKLARRSRAFGFRILDVPQMVAAVGS
jgi:putative PIN family toxin of toxin-antitoxin system